MIDKAAKAAAKLEQLQKDPPCFDFMTHVQTPHGFVEIQDLSVGDLVLARCEKTGEIASRRVTKFFERRYVKIIHVISETDLGGRDRIGTTPEHPFWVQRRGWVEAGSLKAGDVLVGCGDYRVTVHDVIHGEKETFVFNIEVEGFHTYFAGHHAVWVHNSCKVDVITDSGCPKGLTSLRCSPSNDGGQVCCA